MVLIYLSDSLRRLFIEWLQQRVERILVGEIMGDRLVHQFIAEDGCFVLIAVGNLAPDVAEELLTAITLEEPGIAVAVVDIIARLTTRTVVHIENQVEVVGLAPAHHRVDACVTVFLACLSHIVFISEELVVERQADGVGTLRGDEVDIGLRHIVVLELLPELCREVRSHSLLEQQVDHPSRVGAAEAEHIPFRIKPVAKVRALDEEFLAIGLDEVMALDGDKALAVLLSATCCAGGEHEEKDNEERGKRKEEGEYSFRRQTAPHYSVYLSNHL